MRQRLTQPRESGPHARLMRNERFLIRRSAGPYSELARRAAAALATAARTAALLAILTSTASAQAPVPAASSRAAPPSPSSAPVVHAVPARQPCHAVSPQACAAAHALGRGVNLGNALDAPREGDWGLTLHPELLDRAARHFHTVRLPVRWSNHASADAQARIDEAFARRVDAAVDRLLAAGAWVILDLHHYTQLTGGAGATRHPREFAVDEAVVEARMVNLWRQIAARYRDRSPRLLFELLNEPQGTGEEPANEPKGASTNGDPTPQRAATARPLGGERWNRLAARALAAVRETNPERVVLIGPDDWNHPRGLARLRLPADRHLIVTIHSYDPFDFTHQAVPWRQPVLPRGVGCCDDAQRQTLREALDTATAWSRTQGVPLYLGEFGAYREAPMPARAAYARLVREEAEARGIGWAWWEFASDFSPVWDSEQGRWVEPIRRALGVGGNPRPRKD